MKLDMLMCITNLSYAEQQNGFKNSLKTQT